MSVRTVVKSIQDIMRQDTGVDGDAQRISQLCWMFFLKIIDDQDQELELLSSDYRSPIPDTLQWRNWALDPEGITGDDLLDLHQRRAFPGAQEPCPHRQAGRPPPCGRGRVPGCLQLHEIRSVDPAGCQQDITR